MRLHHCLAAAVLAAAVPQPGPLSRDDIAASVGLRYRGLVECLLETGEWDRHSLFENLVDDCDYDAAMPLQQYIVRHGDVLPGSSASPSAMMPAQFDPENQSVVQEINDLLAARLSVSRAEHEFATLERRLRASPSSAQQNELLASVVIARQALQMAQQRNGAVSRRDAGSGAAGLPGFVVKGVRAYLSHLDVGSAAVASALALHQARAAG